MCHTIQREYDVACIAYDVTNWRLFGAFSKELRSSQDVIDTPILALINPANQTHGADLVRAGYVALVLQKPYTPNRLLRGAAYLLHNRYE